MTLAVHHARSGTTKRRLSSKFGLALHGMCRAQRPAHLRCYADVAAEGGDAAALLPQLPGSARRRRLVQIRYDHLLPQPVNDPALPEPVASAADLHVSYNNTLGDSLSARLMQTGCICKRVAIVRVVCRAR